MLKHGILGLLNYGDMCGYEIMEVFRDSLNYFWSAQTSQIYRELDGLEQRGWIRRRTEKQEGKPDRNVCSITKEGREELMRWLSKPDTYAENRFPLLMKVFFMGELEPEESLAFFGKLEKEYTEALNTLEGTKDAIVYYQREVPDPERVAFWQMTSDFGKRYAEMMVEWSRSCIDKIEAAQKSKGGAK
ncbi:MAG: PadR family transcriptional regulator [Oscillospiraceae bacterium]